VVKSVSLMLSPPKLIFIELCRCSSYGCGDYAKVHVFSQFLSLSKNRLKININHKTNKVKFFLIIKHPYTPLTNEKLCMYYIQLS